MACSHTHTHIERFLICFSLDLLPEHLLFLFLLFSFCFFPLPPPSVPLLSLPHPLFLHPFLSFSLSLSVIHHQKDVKVRRLGLKGRQKCDQNIPNNHTSYKLGQAMPLRASQVVLVLKSLPASGGDIRDMDSIPGSGISPGGGSGSPLLCSCLENPLDRGAWQATVHRVAKSRSRLK